MTEPGAAGGRGAGVQLAERLRARRERHRSRSFAYRAAFAAGGTFAVLVGVVMIPFPPLPGVPVILVGLGMLALEFSWAERALALLLEWLPVARERFRRMPVALRVAVAAAVLLLGVAAILALLTLLVL